jgi:hypothetical protein
VQVWLDGLSHQLLYYYLTSVPARQNAIEQKNKASTKTYKFGWRLQADGMLFPHLHKAFFVGRNTHEILLSSDDLT